jgi:hypothetical protein
VRVGESDRGKKGESDLNRSCETFSRVHSIAHNGRSIMLEFRTAWDGCARSPSGAWRGSERSPKEVRSFASLVCLAL